MHDRHALGSRRGSAGQEPLDLTNGDVLVLVASDRRREPFEPRRHRGIIEHGVDGFVYEYDDVDALAGHLRWCHEHPVELAEMGRRAREKALRHPTRDFAKHVLRGIDALA